LVATGAKQIWLFGSHARGEADEDSDVDDPDLNAGAREHVDQAVNASRDAIA
jgi:hypothetical protein